MFHVEQPTIFAVAVGWASIYALIRCINGGKKSALGGVGADFNGHMSLTIYESLDEC
jgi:hypothetical protein